MESWPTSVPLGMTTSIDQLKVHLYSTHNTDYYLLHYHYFLLGFSIDRHVISSSCHLVFPSH